MEEKKRSGKRKHDPRYWARSWVLVLIVIILDISVDAAFHSVLNERLPMLPDWFVSSLTGWPAGIVGLVLFYFWFIRTPDQKG